jgi:hypothetical protein
VVLLPPLPGNLRVVVALSIVLSATCNEVAAMSIDDLTNPQPRPTDADYNADAVSSLRTWHVLVRKLPDLISVEEREPPVRGLVAWYEHVFGYEDYAEDPPIEGIDALIDELAVPAVPYDVHAELARARWAIRVAEELVRWRLCLDSAGPGSPATALATDRLALALQEARRQTEAPLHR